MVGREKKQRQDNHTVRRQKHVGKQKFWNWMDDVKPVTSKNGICRQEFMPLQFFQ